MRRHGPDEEHLVDHPSGWTGIEGEAPGPAEGRLLEWVARADAVLGDGWRAVARRGPLADGVAIHTTDLGSVYMVTGAMVVLLAADRWRDAGRVAAAGTLGWVVAQWIKGTFDRRRPYEAVGVERLIRPPTGSSFPSGHAAVAAAVATVAARRAPRGRRWPWAALGTWVPLTRVHLGVHYPSDVLGGAALGWVLGRLVDAADRTR